MPVVSLGITVPVKDYDRIHALINRMKRYYKIETGKKCTKAKVVETMLTLGAEALSTRLEQESRDKKERLEKLKGGGED